MPIIAPGVARFTVVGRLFGQDCMNVLDAEFETGVGTSREERARELAGDILNNWNDHILPALSAGYTAREVRWVDLDSADGSTGSRTETDGSEWPAEGGTVGQALPNNVYVKVAKILEGKGRRERNGTLRLGGIPESYTLGSDGNVLDPAQILALNQRFEDLKDGINGGAGSVDTNLVVVHTIDQVYSDKSQIASFSVQPVVGTLRRRMPGYGT